MRVFVCVAFLSHCCTAFLVSPVARTLPSAHLSSCANEFKPHCNSSGEKGEVSQNLKLAPRNAPRSKRPVFPVAAAQGASTAPTAVKRAAKDWLKGGSQGRNGPEGPKGRPAPASPGSSPVGGGAEAKDRQQGEGGDQEGQDPRLYSVRIARATGIEWGTDISFSWVYIRALQPDGAAANCGEISVGDQLIAINDQTLAGAPFDVAMDAMIALEGPDVEFTLFRGTTDELKEVVGAKPPPPEITVTVKQDGKPDVALKALSGANLRDFLTENGINVYQSVTRWTNCKGKQLCGTCIVEINEGLESTTIRSLDESSTLRDNPATYRLSCVTNMYDDVTVTVFPPVGASQWTR
ncbi:unnamed protein product [Scytosiphon promiscuus]